MTYCVAIKVNAGMVFCSDSRTNAGVDQVNVYKKMFTFGTPGQRQFIILTSGNLATSQAVMNKLKTDINKAAPVNLLNVNNLHDAADYVGQLSTAQQEKTGFGPAFQASFILGGQISGGSVELVLIYPEGNYISASEGTPFLQIGESKYGKPILDRIIKPDTELHTCALCALVSMDSTVKSNLTVGPPIDIQLYETNSLNLSSYYHLTEDNNYLRDISYSWNEKLIEAFRQLPPLDHSLN